MFIAANWKMNLDKIAINNFIKSINKTIFKKNIQVCIFPPTLYVDYLCSITGNLNISVGAQNCHFKDFGPFTGEVSPLSLKLSGCEYVILGHSERRQHYNENNSYIKKCAEAAIQNNLIPIICVGENFKTRKDGDALVFIKKQLCESLPNNFSKIIIAYEPIWSIGTGQIPNSSEIEQIHSLIKETVTTKKNQELKMLYGGSVNPINSKQILHIKNVDGLLIGGASLNPKDFLAIYSSAVK